LSDLEIVSEDEINEIINFNQKLVTNTNESRGVNNKYLSKIFNCVNSITYEKENDKLTRILKKTSWILGGITWIQPFNEGNRRTAISFTIIFLNRNGYDLSLENLKTEIYALLEKTYLKFEGDNTIYTEIEDFLKSNIRDNPIL